MDTFIAADDRYMYIKGGVALSLARSFFDSVVSQDDVVRFPLTKENLFLLRYGKTGVSHAKMNTKAQSLLSGLTEKPPSIGVHAQRPDKLVIRVPSFPMYTEKLEKLGCWKLFDGSFSHHAYRLPDIMNTFRYEEEAYPDFLLEEGLSGYGKMCNISSPQSFVDNRVQDLVLGHIYNKDNVKYKRKTYDSNFSGLGIESIYDLLCYAPRRYINRGKKINIGNVLSGERLTTVGTILDVVEIQSHTPAVKFLIKDVSGLRISCIFWRQVWLRTKFHIGEEVVVTGKASFFRGTLSISGETIDTFESASLLPVIPIYKQGSSVGLSMKVITAVIREAIESMSNSSLQKLFADIHFPDSEEDAEKAIKEMALKEITATLLLKRLYSGVAQKSVVFPFCSELSQDCLRDSGFVLTDAQSTAISQFGDMCVCDDKNEGVLIADVGAGKTLVSQMVALDAVAGGFQAVFMAPTTVLARQIYDSTVSFVGNKATVGFIDTGMKAQERRDFVKSVKNGDVDIIVGTTSALSSSISYCNLGFVCIDEQQKFGVDQREALVSSRKDGLLVNTISQSATPIPRTVAEVLYNQATVVEMKGKPKGRLPIVTEWVQMSPEEFCTSPLLTEWMDIQRELKEGHKLLVVAPLVEDSQDVEVSSVEGIYKELSTGVLSGYRVGYVHGKMSKNEQTDVIEKMKNDEIDVLVGSAVIEVGVDIKMATRILILSPERMGASSLHQIRGRVGRNSLQSKCWLVTNKAETESSINRLQSLVESNDGMIIAKQDLLTRGEGDLFGLNQSGKSRLHFFSLRHDFDLVERSKKIVDNIMSQGDVPRDVIEKAMLFAGVTQEELG